MKHAGPISGRVIREDDKWFRADVFVRGRLKSSNWTRSASEAWRYVWAAEDEADATFAEGTIETNFTEER